MAAAAGRATGGKRRPGARRAPTVGRGRPSVLPPGGLGDLAEEYQQQEQQEYDQARRAAARAEGRRQGARTPRSGTAPAERLGRVPVGPGVTFDDSAGLLLGLLSWVLVMQYLRGGVPQLKRWMAAKFLNKAPDGSRLP